MVAKPHTLLAAYGIVAADDPDTIARTIFFASDRIMHEADGHHAALVAELEAMLRAYPDAVEARGSGAQAGRWREAVADDDDIRKQFEAAIAGAELDELRRLIPILGAAHLEYVPRPELRKPRRRQPVSYRVTVDLNEAEPRIWRTLELRSDLPLDLVHAVLQGAFSWADSHLYRFSVGGGPFDLDSLVYVCPYDVEDGEVEGIPAAEVRLDETLQEPGDVLQYVYDYGDHWDLALRLDAVLPLAADAVPATCVGGQRAAQPENCGGLRRAEELAEVLEDPERFDLDEVNQGLLDPLLLIHQAGVSAALIKLLLERSSAWTGLSESRWSLQDHGSQA